MNSISELRPLTTGPVGLTNPGRLAAKAAAPASAAQTAEAAVQAAEATPNTKSSSAEIHRRFARFETMDDAAGVPDRDLEFGDLLDIINPLQHIPIVGWLYRSLTGDEISGPAKILGGLLFGGPIGFIASIFDAVVAEAMGRDLGETVMAALFDGGDTGDDLGDVQLAEQPRAATAAEAATVGTPIESPVQPGVQPAGFVATTPAIVALHQAVLTGRGALDAFVRDLKGAGQLVGHGATARDPTPAVVPGLPLPPGDRQIQLAAQPAERARIGAIEPGALGWTIQRRAETVAESPAARPNPSVVVASDLAATGAPLPPGLDSLLELRGAETSSHAAGPGFAAGNPLAGAAGISRQAFSDRVLGALDKYQAVFETRPAGDADRATRLDTRL